MHESLYPISTLTSLRDVTSAGEGEIDALIDFYSHISARCDLADALHDILINISTLTSLRDVTWSSGRSTADMTFLLSHLCEM